MTEIAALPATESAGWGLGGGRETVNIPLTNHQAGVGYMVLCIRSVRFDHIKCKTRWRRMPKCSKRMLPQTNHTSEAFRLCFAPGWQPFKWIGHHKASSNRTACDFDRCAGVTRCLIFLGATFHLSRDEAVCDRWRDIVPFPIPWVNPSLARSLTDAEGGTGPTSLSSYWFDCLNSRGWWARLWGLVISCRSGGKKSELCKSE